MKSHVIRVPLRIGIVQLNPQIGHLKETTARAWKLLEEFETRNKGRNPDILVFPEFALTGYSFLNREHILPYATRTTEGPSYNFAQEVSRRFQCYTVVGYPERCGEDEDSATLYNSAVMIDSAGELVFNYRKSFLYYTDEDWGCEENPEGFQQFEIPMKGQLERDGTECNVMLKTGIGICMDLSNYKFEAPFSDYEFATYHVDHGTELLICPMAWLHSSSVTHDVKDPEEHFAPVKSLLERDKLPLQGSQGHFQVNLDNNDVIDAVPFDKAMSERSYDELEKPDIMNITYWLLRLTPFIATKQRHDLFHRKVLVPLLSNLDHSSSYIGSSLDKIWVHEGKETIAAIANRCGIECSKTVYAGSSGIYKFNGRDNMSERIDTTNKSIDLCGNLGKGLEGILVRDVELKVCREHV